MSRFAAPGLGTNTADVTMSLKLSGLGQVPWPILMGS